VVPSTLTVAVPRQHRSQLSFVIHPQYCNFHTIAPPPPLLSLPHCHAQTKLQTPRLSSRCPLFPRLHEPPSFSPSCAAADSPLSDPLLYSTTHSTSGTIQARGGCPCLTPPHTPPSTLTGRSTDGLDQKTAPLLSPSTLHATPTPTGRGHHSFGESPVALLLCFSTTADRSWPRRDRRRTTPPLVREPLYKNSNHSPSLSSLYL